MNGVVSRSKSNRSVQLVTLAASLFLIPACKGGGVVGTIGVPRMEFGGQLGEVQVAATYPNQCEIDLDFGNIPIGETAAATLKLDNNGAGIMDLSPVAPDLNLEFDLNQVAQGSIAPGSFGQFQVTFQPFQAGQVHSTFTIQTDGTNSTCPNPNLMTVSLTGTGIRLDLVVQPGTLDFGNTIVNTTQRKAITLINKSDAPLSNITATVGGGDASFFTVLDAPATLAPHEQATVNISYAPLAVETRSLANITFEGDGGERATLELFGEPLASALTMTPNPINFGYVQLGTTLTGCTNVTNVSNVPVTLKSITSFATAGTAFLIPTTDDSTPPKSFALPVTLASGATSKVCFAFKPPITQNYNGQATIVTDDPSNNNPIVKLTGWGGGPQITCTPALGAFGQVLDNSVATTAILCTNTGTALPNVKLVMDPPKAAPYAFTAQFDHKLSYPVGGLNPGQSVQIDVSFAPAVKGQTTGLLYLKNNGGQGKTLQIPLAGEGLDIPPCQYRLLPAALDFGNVQPGNSSPSLSFAIKNVGSNVCLVQNLKVLDDTASSFHIQSTSIAPDPTTGEITIPPAPLDGTSELVVSLSFAPQKEGKQISAEAGFTISDPAGPNLVVPLTGTSEPSCVVVAPPVLDFGNVGQSDTGALCGSGARTFSVFSQCPGQGSVNSIVVQSGPGDELPQFTDPLGPTLPIQLSSGSGNEVYEVFFDPTSLGTHTGQILISDGTVETLLSVRGDAVAAKTATDTFVIGEPKADILWIMNTYEDYEEQGTIAGQLPTFFTEGAGVDYRVALTTDNDGANYTGAEFGRLLPCPNCTVVGPTPLVVSPSTQPDPATAFGNLWGSVNSDIYFGQGYHFFLALYNALQQGAPPGVDFYRPGAYFASITDEEYSDPDYSNQGVGGHTEPWFAAYFETYFQNSALFSWNFICPTSPATGTGLSTIKSLPPNIGNMVSATNGYAFNSQDGNWGTALTNIWTAARAVGNNHLLTGTPSQGQNGIVLTVDGVQVDANASPNNPNWTYQSSINSVVFNPNNNPPQPGATVSVTYPISCN